MSKGRQTRVGNALIMARDTGMNQESVGFLALPVITIARSFGGPDLQTLSVIKLKRNDYKTVRRCKPGSSSPVFHYPMIHI